MFTPPSFPEINQFPFMRDLNKRWVEKAVKNLIERFDFQDYISFITTPFMAHMAKQLDEKQTVYDCNDNWLSIPKLPHAYLKEQEELLLSVCDQCFVTSDRLYDEKIQINPNVSLVRSGVDVRHYVEGVQKEIPQPSEFQGIRGPIVGTIGSINATKDDLKLLNALANPINPWTLVVVGPIMGDVSLDDYPYLRKNTLLLGAKDPHRLPDYVKWFDVCVVPYLKNEFTLYANPTKIMEF